MADPAPRSIVNTSDLIAGEIEGLEQTQVPRTDPLVEAQQQTQAAQQRISELSELQPVAPQLPEVQPVEGLPNVPTAFPPVDEGGGQQPPGLGQNPDLFGGALSGQLPGPGQGQAEVQPAQPPPEGVGQNSVAPGMRTRLDGEQVPLVDGNELLDSGLTRHNAELYGLNRFGMTPSQIEAYTTVNAEGLTGEELNIRQEQLENARYSLGQLTQEALDDLEGLDDAFGYQPDAPGQRNARDRWRARVENPTAFRVFTEAALPNIILGGIGDDFGDYESSALGILNYLSDVAVSPAVVSMESAARFANVFRAVNNDNPDDIERRRTARRTLRQAASSITDTAAPDLFGSAQRILGALNNNEPVNKWDILGIYPAVGAVVTIDGLSDMAAQQGWGPGTPPGFNPRRRGIFAQQGEGQLTALSRTDENLEADDQFFRERIEQRSGVPFEEWSENTGWGWRAIARLNPNNRINPETREQRLGGQLQVFAAALSEIVLDADTFIQGGIRNTPRALDNIPPPNPRRAPDARQLALPPWRPDAGHLDLADIRLARPDTSGTIRGLEPPQRTIEPDDLAWETAGPDAADSYVADVSNRVVELQNNGVVEAIDPNHYVVNVPTSGSATPPPRVPEPNVPESRSANAAELADTIPEPPSPPRQVELSDFDRRVVQNPSVLDEMDMNELRGFVINSNLDLGLRVDPFGTNNTSRLRAAIRTHLPASADEALSNVRVEQPNVASAPAQARVTEEFTSAEQALMDRFDQSMAEARADADASVVPDVDPDLDFARNVDAAFDDVPGTFGKVGVDDKALIADVYDAMVSRGTFEGSIEDFQQRLLQLHRTMDSPILLTRADLAYAMPEHYEEAFGRSRESTRRAVEQSEFVDNNWELHFISRPSGETVNNPLPRITGATPQQQLAELDNIAPVVDARVITNETSQSEFREIGRRRDLASQLRDEDGPLLSGAEDLSDAGFVEYVESIEGSDSLGPIGAPIPEMSNRPGIQIRDMSSGSEVRSISLKPDPLDIERLPYGLRGDDIGEAVDSLMDSTQRLLRSDSVADRRRGWLQNRLLEDRLARPDSLDELDYFRENLPGATRPSRVPIEPDERVRIERVSELYDEAYVAARDLEYLSARRAELRRSLNQSREAFENMHRVPDVPPARGFDINNAVPLGTRLKLNRPNLVSQTLDELEGMTLYQRNGRGITQLEVAAGPHPPGKVRARRIVDGEPQRVHAYSLDAGSRGTIYVDPADSRLAERLHTATTRSVPGEEIGTFWYSPQAINGNLTEGIGEALSVGPYGESWYLSANSNVAEDLALTHRSHMVQEYGFSGGNFLRAEKRPPAAWQNAIVEDLDNLLRPYQVGMSADIKRRINIDTRERIANAITTQEVFDAVAKADANGPNMMDADLGYRRAIGERLREYNYSGVLSGEDLHLLRTDAASLRSERPGAYQQSSTSRSSAQARLSQRVSDQADSPSLRKEATRQELSANAHDLDKISQIADRMEEVAEGRYAEWRDDLGELDDIHSQQWSDEYDLGRELDEAEIDQMMRDIDGFDNCIDGFFE